jgi:hypothetical protein
MNDVKLRHIDEPQMNGAMNEECHLAPIKRAFYASFEIFYVNVTTRLPLCAV